MSMLGKSRVKYIQSLGQKKFRDSEQAFIAEGPKIVEECLYDPVSHIKAVYALDEWISGQKKLPDGIIVEPVTPEELEKISQLKTPNQVLAVLEKRPSVIHSVNESICLALADVQDPGNLGTIIRIADWFGIKQIVCSPLTADMYNPKVIQSTMGSFTRVNVVYTELDTWLKEQKQNGVKVYATTLGGQALSSISKPEAGIVLIGNESKGISDTLLELADVQITIPGKGGAESLNAAVATGIILSHLT